MRNNYGCDLDALGTGSRIGMMRTSKGDLHYFINGQDQGAACSGLPPGKGDYSVAFNLPPPAWPTLAYQGSDSFLSYPEVYAVVDLYGQCVQVSITNATGPMDNSLATSNTATEKSFPLHSPGAANREGGWALLPAVGLRNTTSTSGKREGKTHGRKQPGRGQEFIPVAQGLDTSLPQTGRDTISWAYQILLW